LVDETVVDLAVQLVWVKESSSAPALAYAQSLVEATEGRRAGGAEEGAPPELCPGGAGLAPAPGTSWQKAPAPF